MILDDENVIPQTKIPYKYVFESHLLEIDEKSFMASLVLPADTEVLDVIFNEAVKGIFALVKHTDEDSFVGTTLNKLKFNFIFVGIHWEVDGDIIDRSDYVTTINTSNATSTAVCGSIATYHVYVNYETLVEDNEVTREIVREVEAAA